MSSKILRLILGDQLNLQHSWYQEVNDSHTYIMMEVLQETNYVNHHIQKVLAFFSSMRQFSEELKARGHKVIYLPLDSPTNLQSIDKNLEAVIAEGGFQKFEYQEADEYRLDLQLSQFCDRLNIESSLCSSEHFYTTRLEMKDFFEKKKSKQWLMESFYRNMRKKHDLLMEGENVPMGGKWNYDHSNRMALPKGQKVIEPLTFKKDVGDLVKMLNKMNVKTIGKIKDQQLIWPTNRKESLELLKFFIEECLAVFGDFQDAMSEEEWSLYHSRLSFSMNTKMLSPKEVVDATIAYWNNNKEKIDISQVEGFVRQIIGWREYMRGIYWSKMPEYYERNHLDNQAKLPNFYWTGDTKMACLKKAIDQSLDYAYAHHIQRLMITGNFALLAGCDPKEVDEWYLGIYIDAIEWVELPNTRGMSQYADGGLIATKPYVSSANYIKKMGNHCNNCHYSHSKKEGEGSCPFNTLYWNFIDQHLDKWEKNQRMSMVVNNWKKRKPEDKERILKQAHSYLENIDSL